MLLLWSRKRVMSVLIYVFEGRMGFLFYFPSAKIDAFPQAECREHLALEISLPQLFIFLNFFILPVGCLGLTSWFLALMCQFCLHMPVPKVPSHGQVVWAGARDRSWSPTVPSALCKCPWAQPSPPSSCLGLSDVPQPPHMVLAKPFWWGIYAGPGWDFCQIVVRHFCSKIISWFSVDDNNLGKKKWYLDRAAW